MTDTDYMTILNDALAKLGFLGVQRDNIETEMARLRQFVAATVNMLPDNQKAQLNDRINQVLASSNARVASLTEAIKTVLRDAGSDWLTVRQVRDRLEASAFDFSGYTTNPLASVSTTLKRMNPQEVETTTIEGVTAYRRKRRFRMAGGKFKGKFGVQPVIEDT